MSFIKNAIIEVRMPAEYIAAEEGDKKTLKDSLTKYVKDSLAQQGGVICLPSDNGLDGKPLFELVVHHLPEVAASQDEKKSTPDDAVGVLVNKLLVYVEANNLEGVEATSKALQRLLSVRN